MKLVDLWGDTLRHARNGRILIAAGGYNHLIGGENANIRRDFERIRVIPLKAAARYPFLNGWSEGMRVRFNVGNNLIFQHKSVRIRSGIRMTGQLALPVWR